MDDINKITDRKTLVLNRKRALTFKDSYNEMHQLAIKEIEDRLNEINRKFKDIAIITGHPDIWVKAFPNAHFVEDTDTLVFEQNCYDLIIHALCLHWSNDPVGQLIQCKNKLVEDGLFLAILFGGKTLYELNLCFSLAESRISGGISPRFVPMGEIRDLGNLLQRAGFGLPVADNIINHLIYKNVYSLITDLRKMGETNALLSRKKSFTRKKIFEETAKIYLEKFTQNDINIIATVELIFLTGWCPSETQQKPLKPGSGKINLGVLLDDFAKKTTDSPRQHKKK